LEAARKGKKYDMKIGEQRGNKRTGKKEKPNTVQRKLDLTNEDVDT
jgi:hypothetical protein